MTQKRLVKIKNWKLVGWVSDEYKAPELAKPVLVGVVNNGFQDEIVRTSEVVWLAGGGKIAETLNTFYDLGNPDPEWVEELKAQGKKPSDYVINNDSIISNVEKILQ